MHIALKHLSRALRRDAYRRSLAAVFSLLVLIPLGQSWSTPALAADPEKEQVEEFDPDSVDNIDPAILAEMKEQAGLQPAVDALSEVAASEPESGFAGVAYEGAGLTLYYKGSLSAAMSDAVIEANSVGPVVVMPAAYSRSELQVNSDRITSLATKAASDVQAVALATDGSGLTVEQVPPAIAAANKRTLGINGLDAPTSAVDVVEEAGVTVPVKVVTATEPITLAATTRNDDFAPWNGGSRFEVWRNGAYRTYCTSGFGVKNNAGERFMLTAAHCVTPPDYARQGKGATLEYMGPVYQQSVAYDLAIIRANGSALIFDGTTNTSNTKRVAGWAYWAANQLVCQSGVTSGTVCAIRQKESADVVMGCCDSDGDQGYTLKGLIRSPRDGGGIAVRGGDSGGPVFTYDGSNVIAKGITSSGAGSSTLYFQDWADVGRIWGLSPWS